MNLICLFIQVCFFLFSHTECIVAFINRKIILKTLSCNGKKYLLESSWLITGSLPQTFLFIFYTLALQKLKQFGSKSGRECKFGKCSWKSLVLSWAKPYHFPNQLSQDSSSKDWWQIKDKDHGFHHWFINCTIGMVSHQQHELGEVAAEQLSSHKNFVAVSH